MKAFNVYLGKRLVDTVFYSKSANVTVDEVKKSLIEHDGYNPAIEVKQQRKRKEASHAS